MQPGDAAPFSLTQPGRSVGSGTIQANHAGVQDSGCGAVDPMPGLRRADGLPGADRPGWDGQGVAELQQRGGNQPAVAQPRRAGHRLAAVTARAAATTANVAISRSRPETDWPA